MRLKLWERQLSKYTKSKLTNKSLSIFLPAYNEEENVKQSVITALNVAKKITDDFEVIVIDDGSNDKTGKIIDELGKKYSKFRPIHQKNQGYGGAVWSGIKNSKKNIIFFTDCDLQFDISELKKFIPFIKNYNAVFGFRKPRKDPFMRLLNAWGWKVLNRLLLGVKVKDIDCAFKLFDKKVFDRIRKVDSRGAMFSAELIYRMQKAKMRIKELPVKHYPRKAGSPTGAKPSVIIKAFKELWKVYKTVK